MNARTSRLLRRVAFAAHMADTAKPKEPLAHRSKGLKQAWNRTPRSERATTRRALVAIFHNIIEGARA